MLTYLNVCNREDKNSYAAWYFSESNVILNLGLGV